MDNVTKGMQYKEAVSRIRKMKFAPNVLKDFREGVINKSERMGPFCGILYWLDEEEKDFVKKWEEKSGNLAYHMIKDATEMGTMRSILYVSKYKEEWEMDNNDLDENTALAYAIIGLDEIYGEYGSIGICKSNGGLQRTW